MLSKFILTQYFENEPLNLPSNLGKDPKKYFFKASNTLVQYIKHLSPSIVMQAIKKPEVVQSLSFKGSGVLSILMSTFTCYS